MQFTCAFQFKAVTLQFKINLFNMTDLHENRSQHTNKYSLKLFILRVTSVVINHGNNLQAKNFMFFVTVAFSTHCIQ